MPVNAVVYADSQQYGEGKTRDKAIDTQYQGVPQYIHKIRRGKKALEIVEPDPGTAPNSKPRLETFKRHENAIYGDIVENHHIYKGNKQ
jgi:hypothetical protein